MNRRRMWVWVVGLALMASGSLQAQLFHHSRDPLPPDPVTQPSDLTVDQLIAKNNAARGGEAKLKAVKSMKMSGTWEANVGTPSPILIQVAPGRYMRRIADGPKVTLINVVDGAKTWEITPGSGVTKASPINPKAAVRFQHLADPQGPLVDAKAKGNKVEAMGRFNWKDTPVYKLKVTFPNGGVNYLYLDAKSFLVVRTVSGVYVPPLGKSIDMELVFKDYRDVDGVKVPFLELSDSPESGLKYQITYKSIEINKPLDEAAFKAPAS